jgi:predicted nucleic acid-binding protein
MKADGTRRLVLDASVAVAWCFPDESTEYAERVLDLLASGSGALVPAIWPFEVANALLVGERRKRVTLAQVTALLQRLTELPIMVDPIQVSGPFGRILSLARQQQLSEYDAAYLELALREGQPLATLDHGLRRACRNAGGAWLKT